MRSRILVAASLAFAVAAGASLPAASVAKAKKKNLSSGAGPLGVVALIDAGINPYSVAFRDRSALARRHPSTYIPGYPKDAEALRLTLDAPYEEAVEKDAAVWARARRGILYWIPGTRIVGAISFGAGGTCSSDSPPPVNAGGGCNEHVILDDHGHGTMTSSRAAGAPRSLAPDARIVMIEGLGEQGVRWAADAGWIDVQSNSWLNLVPPPANSSTPEAFAHAAEKMVTIAASGNGTAYIMGAAPTPTYVLSTAPPGVILVGGHDNGKMTLWSGSPPHVVADAYSGFTAIRDSTKKMRPAPIACCTSAAAPYAAGGAVAIIQEARAILGDRTSGIKDGVIARGRKGVVKEGPLADGEFTLEEFTDLYFHTANPTRPRAKTTG
ncbi:MAG: S8 family serine peptidase [Actinomycetota bacterium]